MFRGALIVMTSRGGKVTDCRLVKTDRNLAFSPRRPGIVSTSRTAGYRAYLEDESAVQHSNQLDLCGGGVSTQLCLIKLRLICACIAVI